MGSPPYSIGTRLRKHLALVTILSLKSGLQGGEERVESLIAEIVLKILLLTHSPLTETESQASTQHKSCWKM